MLTQADEGISGKNIEDRPAVKRMIEDIINKKVNNVLVYKVDRLTRSTKNLIELVEIFNQNNCAFNSLMESIDTNSATGRMFLKIVGIFAEFERENLIERVKLGFERKAKEGYSLCSFIPSYGYNREAGTKIQEIDTEESEIVSQIFSMYLNDDYPCTKIAKVLNAQGIPTKRDRKWGAKTIRLVLSNPNYVGKVRYACKDVKKYFEADGKHEAIIDEETFYSVQEKMSRIKKITRTKRPSERVYFCGILFCSICGSKLSPKWNYSGGAAKAAYPSYRCLNALRGGCKAKTMSHAKLEKAFEDFLSNIEDFSEVNEVELPRDTTNGVEKEKLIRELARIEKKINEITELFVSNTIGFEAYQNMMKLSNEKRNELEARLNSVLSREPEAVYTKADFTASLKTNWIALSNEERQRFIQKFIKKISLHSELVANDRFGTVFIKSVEFNEFYTHDEI